MADIREHSIGLLSSTTIADMKSAATHSLFTIPAGKIAIITHVVVHTPSATLAGGTDYGFGVAADCTSFKQPVTLTTVTATNHYFVVDNNNVCTIATATQVFSMEITDGSDGDASAVVDVFGYLFDAA